MGPKRKPFRCGWLTLWVSAVCMVETGRAGVATELAEGLRRVKSDGLAMSALLPLYPRKPTFFVRGGMSQKGQNRRFGRQPTTSGLPPETDTPRDVRHVSNGPTG